MPPIGVFQAGNYGYEMIGMWVNDRAAGDYGLKQGDDYSITQFPAMGAGHDDVSSVDSKEFSEFANANNPAAADAFLAWLSTKEAADIVASHGLASPSNKVDASLYGPVQSVCGRRPSPTPRCSSSSAICCRAIWSTNTASSCRSSCRTRAMPTSMRCTAAIEAKAARRSTDRLGHDRA